MHIAHELQTAFMGDDTWMTVFPTPFSPNMTYPYDSFNVEDLHSVDEGVIRHLFPLLEDETHAWDAIVGHFLGVDHVGHRVGPDHPAMTDKLRQMDNVLRRVVELLEEDTLLVVLGDHGMDRKGDHGGDDVFETSSAMWIYSKGPALQFKKQMDLVPSELLPTAFYPGSSVAHRYIQQIDLVPTLSLLLGLPIPFNNLGTVIPDLFARKDLSALRTAMRLNTEQIKRYLDAYRSSTSSSDLEAVWASLETAWEYATADEFASVSSQYVYSRLALQACRTLWAQFNVLLMSVGLVVLGLSVITVGFLYRRLSDVSDWERWGSKRVSKLVPHTLYSIIAGPLMYLPLQRFLPGIGLVDFSVMISSITSCTALLLDTLPSFSAPSMSGLPIVLILHGLIFFSNSFTFWEDRIVPFLLISCLVPALRVGLTAPNAVLRRKILVNSAIFALCVRLLATITVCREEQQPYCHVTFYASSSLPSPPPIVLALSVPISIGLPYAIKLFLARSASDKGLVPTFLSYVLRPTLLGGSLCWIFEWIESSDILVSEWSEKMRTWRTFTAWSTVAGIALGTYRWWLNPLCVEIRVQKKEGSEKPNAVVVVNANAYGSPFVLFWCTALAAVYLTMQLTGQVALGVATIACFAYLDVSDAMREAHAWNAKLSKLSAALDTEQSESAVPFTFSHTVVFPLLGLLAYYATGHQSTLSSLQWKAAFLLTPKLTYPFSPLLVIVNTFGPQFLFALATPLLACWLVAPTSEASSRASIIGESVRASIGVMLYHSVLLLSSAASSAWLRRHLMVWKVFAPRFMAAAASLLVTDLAVIIAVGFGIYRSSGRVANLLENMYQTKSR